MKALLIDTVSIQHYIFSSNKLRENLGASEIVKNIYNELIPLADSAFYNNTDKWKNDTNDKPTENCIGYIGGGNALLFFKDDYNVKEFIGKFSKEALLNYPGLKLASVLENFDFDKYKESIEALHTILRENKNKYLPVVTVPKHGITADCPLSNESAEVHDTKSNQWISRVTHSKFKSVENATTQFETLKNSKYKLPNEFEEISLFSEKGYIAIVHIDGNGIGDKFSKSESLTGTRQLSKQVEDLANGAFDFTCNALIGFLENKAEKTKWKWNAEKTTLPIRPIIIGGDDITFVCEGRLGVYLSEKFIEHFCSKEINGEKLSACAGIAIVHTKFPFYKAYQLAEELIRGAKKKAKQEPGSSYLDYLIFSSGFSGSLENILKKQLTVNKIELHNGPYQLDKNDKNESFAIIKNGIKEFIDEKKWARSKVLAVRESLTQEEKEQEYQKNQFKKDVKLPKVGNIPNNHFSSDNKTPYFDMIELMDFYPTETL